MQRKPCLQILGNLFRIIRVLWNKGDYRKYAFILLAQQMCRKLLRFLSMYFLHKSIDKINFQRCIAARAKSGISFRAYGKILEK